MLLSLPVVVANTESGVACISVVVAAVVNQVLLSLPVVAAATESGVYLTESGVAFIACGCYGCD